MSDIPIFGRTRTNTLQANDMGSIWNVYVRNRSITLITTGAAITHHYARHKHRKKRARQATHTANKLYLYILDYVYINSIIKTTPLNSSNAKKGEHKSLSHLSTNLKMRTQRHTKLEDKRRNRTSNRVRMARRQQHSQKPWRSGGQYRLEHLHHTARGNKLSTQIVWSVNNEIYRKSNETKNKFKWCWVFKWCAGSQKKRDAMRKWAVMSYKGLGWRIGRSDVMCDTNKIIPLKENVLNFKE